MNNHANWKRGIRPARKAVGQARETLLFLHLAKTGGSSVGWAMRKSTAWESIRFPAAHAQAGQTCVCGGVDCAREARDLQKLAQSPSLITSDLGLYIMTGHSRFSDVSWLKESLTSRHGSPQMFTTVRPARERIVSMFRDYWEQVSNGEKYAAGTAEPRNVHQRYVGASYVEDAQHYRDANGDIDGHHWFTTFAEFRGGIPFLLDDVFEGRPEALEGALASGTLNPIPTRELDGHLTTWTGKEPVRRRVSSPTSPAIVKALDDAADVIDELAAIDAPYDLLLGEHLGITRFDPKRSR